jgi:hypothetical protein
MNYVIKPDDFGGWDVYAQTGDLKYIDTYETLEEAQADFPDAEVYLNA